MFAVIETDVQENQVTDVILCNTDEEYAKYLQQRFDLSEEDAADMADQDFIVLIPDYDENYSYETWTETTEDNEEDAECKLLKLEATDMRE